VSGILNALYIRGDDLERVRAHYRDEYDLDGLEGRVGAAFLAVEVSASSDFVEDPDLSADSTAFGEAILVQLTSFGTDDVFLYDHWRQGQVARRLHYAPRAWTLVEGTPEPWEERAFLDTPKRGAAASFATEGVLAALIKHLGLPSIWPR
jgi:hypothetical protein